MFNARALTRAGPEAAAAFTTRYQEQLASGNNGTDEERQLRQPISATEVEEASSMIFQRAPTTPSDYVFSPSATVPSGPTGGHVYPRLRRNQVLRAEVLAMGHRLAAHPGVQNAIFDDLAEHGRRVPPGRRGIHPNLQAPPGDERGLARLVDMLEPEEEASQRATRTTRSSGGTGPGQMVVQRDRRGLFDYDDESPLPHLHLDPRVSDELEGVYASVQDDGWEPWSEEKKEDASQNELLRSRLGDGKLGCSCKKCHAAKDPLLAAADEDPSEGNCWKDVLAEYECDICFEVLVGVHVLDNCGHHFCGACMERWIDNAPQGECPVCRTPVDKLVPVRKMDEMIAKAVDAAAPSKERDAWYKRRAHWQGNARRRQEARAAGPLLSVVHAQGTSAGGAGWGRPGVASRYGGGGVDPRGGPAGVNEREDEGGDGEEEDDGFRLNKMQTVIAVAVMLVMAVMKIRGLR